MSYSSALIAVVGQTGTGKSTALENMNPEDTFIINVSNKPLPFKAWKNKYKVFSTVDGKSNGGNYYVPMKKEKADDTEWVDLSKIINIMKYVNSSLPHVKNLIIDDFQYIMADEFMNRAYEKTWDKWSEMGRHIYEILTLGRRLRENLKVFILTHDELVTENNVQKRKIKTLGKLLDEKITLEGLFTYVLFTHVEKVIGQEFANYSFITNTDGFTTAKSPKGCLPYKMPNDLSLVVKAIDDYQN